jgi:hypothetical protein
LGSTRELQSSLRCRKTGAPLCIGSDQDEAQHLN